MRILFTAVMLLFLFLPAAHAQDWAKARLDKSPRHLDWVKVKAENREIKCFIAYPQKKEKAISVLVIHEIFGLSDWVRSVCDELAEQGYIAIAPDLLSGKPGEDSTKYDGNDSLRRAIVSLPKDEVTADLKAAADYVRHLPAANGKLAVAGFCWGGAESFRFAASGEPVRAALVFYGTPADADAMKRINAPVYGFYAEDDARVTATVEQTKTAMKAAQKTYEAKIYSGAGHGFMRTGESPEGKAEDKSARHEAWKRMISILNKL